MWNPLRRRSSIYATPPRTLPDSTTDWFYHVTDLPDGRTTVGQWDLRGHESEYLGGVDFTGKRVLEIGPASGFLTAWMERNGADVTAVELPRADVWDFIPHHRPEATPTHAERIAALEQLRQTFWYTHKTFGLGAKLIYAAATNLPTDLGRFDVAVVASVLLHMRDPLGVINAIAERADCIVVVEPYFDRVLEDRGEPLVRLNPTPTNGDVMTWWNFSTGFFRQYFAVLGLHNQHATYHRQLNGFQKAHQDFFTIVASR